MQIGERFPLAGYDILATAATDDGQVLVLNNNNSSHFLVAENQTSGVSLQASGRYDVHSVNRIPTAVLLGSFFYDSITGSYHAYLKAVLAMASYSLTHCDSMREDS